MRFFSTNTPNLFRTLSAVGSRGNEHMDTDPPEITGGAELLHSSCLRCQMRRGICPDPWIPVRVDRLKVNPARFNSCNLRFPMCIWGLQQRLFTNLTQSVLIRKQKVHLYKNMQKIKDLNLMLVLMAHYYADSVLEGRRSTPSSETHVMVFRLTFGDCPQLTSLSWMCRAASRRAVLHLISTA